MSAHRTQTRGNRISARLVRCLMAGFVMVGLLGSAIGEPGKQSGEAGEPRQVGWASVEVGMCTTYAGVGDVPHRLDVVDCDSPHRGEFFWVDDLPPGPFPGDDRAEKAVDKQCRAFDLPSPADYHSTLSPTRAWWASGDRRGFCLAVSPEAAWFSGSLESLRAAEKLRWYPLLWIDAFVFVLLSVCYACTVGVFRRVEKGRVAHRAQWLELWWFALPVGGIAFALLFPNGTRRTTVQLPFPVMLTIMFTTLGLIAVACLVARSQSGRRLLAAQRRYPEARVLEGVRLAVTRSALTSLEGRRVRLNYWYPVIVTKDRLLIDEPRGRVVALMSDDITAVATTSRSVSVGNGRSRTVNLLEVQLAGSAQPLPIAIRSRRWNAFVRYTADQAETAEVAACVRSLLGPARRR